VYVLAGGGKGRYVFTGRRQDPEAVAFFCKWVPRLRAAYSGRQAYRGQDVAVKGQDS
jgi:hypothetical protein